MSRGETSLSSKYHFFASHFYTHFERSGYKGVQSWTRKINLFEKKLVFIPINKEYHWSLLVIVNPGSIVDSASLGEDEKQEAPLSCLIFFDSLRMHNTRRVAKNIRDWLNEVWNRQAGDGARKDPFTAKSFPVFTPTGKSLFVRRVSPCVVGTVIDVFFVSPLAGQWLRLWCICLSLRRGHL